MKKRKIIIWLLVITVLFVLSGVIIKSEDFWTVADIVVILVCGGIASYLLLQKDDI